MLNELLYYVELFCVFGTPEEAKKFSDRISEEAYEKNKAGEALELAYGVSVYNLGLIELCSTQCTLQCESMQVFWTKDAGDVYKSFSEEGLKELEIHFEKATDNMLKTFKVSNDRVWCSTVDPEDEIWDSFRKGGVSFEAVENCPNVITEHLELG